MKQQIKSKLILCIILVVSTLNGIIFSEYNLKYVEDNYNSENDIISNLEGASGNWDPQITKSVGDSPHSVFIGDANNDGYNDIATANIASDDISILLWNSTSNDWDSPITRSAGDSPYSVFIGDANNDGYNDIAIANVASDDISIFLWNSTSNDWDSPITRSAGDQPRIVFIGDANNDGYNDIATANYMSNDISIFLWNITIGDWDTQITKSVGNGPQSVFIGDANNDGYNDIATTNWYSYDVSILLWNSSSGNWDPQITRAVGYYPDSVFIEDANNDGYNDIATANDYSDDVSILLWNSTSDDWDPQITKPVGDKPKSIFIEDANNDGYNDIATANYDSNDVSILLRNSTSDDWDPQITKSVGDSPYSVFIGDANNDGYNDIATANYYSDDVSIFLWKPPPPYISIIFPENETYGYLKGYYPATFGFESDINGEDAKNWTHNVVSNTHSYIVDSYNTHQKVYELWDNTLGNPDTYNTFANQTYGTVESWVLISLSGYALYFDVQEELSVMARCILVTGDYLIVLNDSTLIDLTEFGIIQPNQWYHIRIDFRSALGAPYMGLAKDTFAVYLNGVKSNSNYNLSLILANANRIRVTTGYSAADPNYYVYFDAVGYSWDPNYNIGDNLYEGLLLSYDTNLVLDWIGYSLDYKPTKTILGNTTIPMPEDGVHTIQIFGNDSFGTDFQSDLRYFTVDLTAPEIIVNTPISNDFFGSVAPYFNITVIEPNLEKMWYTLDEGLTNTTFNEPVGTINQTIWNAHPNGTVYIRFYANDTSGHIGFIEIVVNKDTYPPNIIINSPSFNQLLGKSSPNFDIYINESNINTIWYTLDGGLMNITINELSGTINQAIWNTCPNGSVYIKFYVNDKAGNIGFEEVVVKKDILPPDITINSPYQNQVFQDQAPTFDLFIIEGNLYEIWYTLDNGIVNITCGKSGQIDQDLWNALSPGIYILKFYANDIMGNEGFSEVIIEKREEGISVYNPMIILLISILGIFIIILRIRKKMKNN